MTHVFFRKEKVEVDITSGGTDIKKSDTDIVGYQRVGFGSDS